MLILTIRTDKPEAEIGLYEDDKKLAYETWQAHRTLSETIHLKIKDLLSDQKKSLQDIKGVVCYKGPGSFTGLRIGLSVANSLAYGLETHIVGTTGENWIEDGVEELKTGKQEPVIKPEYGAPAHITTPKK